MNSLNQVLSITIGKAKLLVSYDYIDNDPWIKKITQNGKNVTSDIDEDDLDTIEKSIREKEKATDRLKRELPE
jgi:hypothetical protein